MGISKISYGSGDNLFEISYKDDEVITDSGSNSYMSNNFEANAFAAFQSKKLTKFFEAGPNNSYNDATEDNCIWRKWDGWNRTDLLAGADVPDGYYTFNSLLTDNGSGRRIVTELTDIQRVIWKPEVMENYVDTYINGTSTRVYYYTINTSTNQNYCDIIDATNPMHYTAQGVPIFPWLLNPHNKTQLQVHFTRGDDLSPWGNSCYRYAGSRLNGINNERYYPVSTALINYDVPSANNQNFAFYDDTNSYIMWCSVSTLNYASASLRCYITSEDELKLYMASCGFKFIYKNRLYKPVVENNVIVGYTDDMLSQSEWDNWHTKDDHEKPVTPPPPGPSGGGDDYADMSLGVPNVTLGGLTKYAILSKQELINLIIDYNTNQATAGTNFSNHIICLYRLGFAASDLVVTNSDKIKMIQSAGNVDFESSANYSIVTRQTTFIYFGSIKVPRHTGTFYDFSPYSSYEIYIPGCGWIPLPDNVAGRTLSVYLVFDLPTCSAKGIVRIEGGLYGGTTIATVNGIIGASVPFTIGENGIQRAAVMSANAQVAAGIATGIVGATINPMMAVAGGAELLSGLMNAYAAGNTNYVSTKGGAGDFSVFGDGAEAMLKYNAPEIDPVVNNSDFGHTVGYMCNETGQLSNFHGFTVCSNPHIHISATSTEKEEIKRLLEEGVILP